MSAAIGGSFNVSAVDNSVNSYIGQNAKVTNAKDVDVVANNMTELYKGAGGLSITSGGSGSGTSVGAGMAANINVIKKETQAQIMAGADVSNSGQLKVSANDTANPTEKMISVGVGGSIVTGGNTGFNFAGAIGVDVLDNTTKALINSSKIASSSIIVAANDYVSNGNITGAITFSTAPTAYGIGIGTVVSVVDNETQAKITNSEITTTSSVEVNAKEKEDLKFLALNGGLTTGSSGGVTLNANAIVNVENNKTTSAIENSIVSSGNLSVLSSDDSNIQGITAVGSLALGAGNVLGGNIIANIINNQTKSYITGTDVNSSGALKVSANAFENIDVIPASVVITVSGSLAAAANISANVITNETTAYVSGKKSADGKIKAASAEISVSDNTVSKSRGGTLAVSGSSAGVGGSLLADVYVKRVGAFVGEKQPDGSILASNTTLETTGNTTVKAFADNSFGPSPTQRDGELDMSSLSSTISSLGSAGFDTLLSYANWEMVFDAAGGNSAGVSGSLIAKVMNNDVQATIGKNAKLTAGDVDVLASNTTYVRAIVGNITGGGNAAVGGSMFANIAIGNTKAGIQEGASVTTTSGDVDISADSVQDFQTIMLVGGGAGSVSVNGSINVNTVVNTTKAYIDNDVSVNSAGKLNVIANETVDVTSLNFAGSGSGTAAIGGIAYVNAFSNNTIAQIGNESTKSAAGKTVVANGDVKVQAKSKESFGAAMAMIAGSGSAAVSGVGVANVVASKITAGIDGSDVTSTNGSVSVKAEHNYNEEEYGAKSLNFLNLANNVDSNKSTISASYILNTANQLIPVVSILNIAGSGAAAVNGTLVVNTINNQVNAYVDDSKVSSRNGLSINALSKNMTYDAVMGVAASAYASIALTGVTNVITGTTKSYLKDSIVSNGNVSLDAKEELNLNGLLFAVTGSGVGASISGIANVNTVANNVYSKIENSQIQNSSAVSVSATNKNQENTIAVAGAGTGIGAAIKGILLSNVLIGNTAAGISDNSVISKGSTTLSAINDTDIFKIATGGSVTGIGFDGGAYIMADVIDNDLRAYIENSTLSNNTAASVSAISTLDFTDVVVSVGFTGVGASIMANNITNVVNNDVQAFIKGSTVTNGSASTIASQTTNIDAKMASISAGGLSVAGSANAIVDVFTNRTKAYIEDTEINSASSVSASATTTQNLIGDNIGVSGAGLGGVGLSVLVNVLENETNAYIDSKAKNITTSGLLEVKAADTLTLNNIAGVASVGAFGVSGSANVNVINNSVMAELLSSTGQITAGNVDVNSSSTVALGINTAAIAGGGVGLSGAVAVTSIGDKFDSSDKESKMETSDSVSKTTSRANQTKVTYTKDGKSKTTADVSLAKTVNSAKRGTVANIDANVSATKAGGIDVTATNTLKGLSGDTSTITNASVAIGSYAAGASVLVTDMKYNTTAEITGGTISSAGDIDVKAENNLKTNTNAISAAGGLGALAGNVAYFKNKASSTAQITYATITSAPTVGVKALSSDRINANAISGSAGVGAVNVAIALAETQNSTKANVQNSDITATNVNINAQNTSNLSSELEAVTVGGVAVSVLVNSAKSQSSTEALVQGDSDIKASNNFNLLSTTDGIGTEATVRAGNVGIVGVSAVAQKAETNAQFNSKILNTSKVKAKNVNIKAGVDKDNLESAGNVSAEVSSVKASAGVYTATATLQQAVSNAVTNIELASGASVEADEQLNVLSSLNRTATTGSTSANIGLLSIGALTLESTVEGASNVNMNGSLIADAVDLKIKDTSNARTKMISGTLSLVGASGLYANSTVNNDAKIVTNNINANTISLSTDTTKNASISNVSTGASLLNISGSVMKTQVSGTSGVEMNGNVRAKNGTGSASSLDITVADTTKAENESASYSLSLVGGNDLTIWSTADSEIANAIGGNIKASSINLVNNLDRTAIANSSSSSGSLGSISNFTLLTRVGNGAETIFDGTINTSALSADSNIKNTVKTYMKDNTTALAALARGSVQNNIYDTNTNYIKFNSGSDVTSTNALDVSSQITNNVAMTANTSSTAFIGVRGGTLKNNINSTSGVEFNSAKVASKNMNVVSENETKTIQPVKLDDSASGFVTSAGIVAESNIVQTNNVAMTGNTSILTSNDLVISENNKTNYNQGVESGHRGFSANNRGRSTLNVTSNNNFTMSDTAEARGKNTKVNLNSNNTLTSTSDIDASSFAGDPSSKSTIDLTINNTVNIGSGTKLSASELLNINYMKNSINNLVQDSYVFAEAAIATADWAGGIEYRTDNQLNIASSGILSSDKDVVLNYANGQNSLSSRVAYKKVSRILFGIPITKRGSSSRITISNSNSLLLNGLIQAGENNNRHMIINRDGTVSSATEGFTENQDYRLVNTVEITSSEATQNAVNEITSEINYLNTRLSEMNSSESENKAQMDAYNTQIAELTNLLTALGNTITETDVNNTIKSNVQGSSVGEASHQVSQSIFDALWPGLKDAANATARTTILNSYVVTPAHDDKPAVMLSDAQKGTIASAFNAEAAKFGEESITKTSTYNGKIISDSDLTTELINNTTSAKNSLQTAYNQLSTVNADIATKKASLTSEIQDLNDQKTYLNAHPLPAISISNSSVDFNDLISKPSKIEINGLLPNSITGNGNFKIFGSSIVVDNYSPRYLIFKNINLDNASGSGLIINGINYSYLANTGTKIGSGNVKLIRDYGSVDSELAGTITVNNFFDYMNAALTNAKPSNIVFNGSVINTNNAFNIFNDSGDIFFNNRISSSKLNAVASLGSISYKGGGNFNLLSNSRLIAGRDISVNASNIKIDGTVKAGNSDRNLTITDSMLSSLVVDPTTGETNMINLGGTEKSAYLNGTNNIKALYKDNKIILFNTESTSGSVNLNGTVTGSGTVTYSDGYGTVSVNNQTSKELVVNNLANNYGAGTFTNKGTIASAKITKNGVTSASTDITSTGLANIKGKISSGNNGSSDDGHGALNISSSSGVVIANKLDSFGSQTETIDATGTVGLSNSGVNGINILGKIFNRKGNTTVSNTNTGASSITVASTGKVVGKFGDISVSSAGTGGIQVSGLVENRKGNTTLTNTAGGINVASGGEISNSEGDLTVENNGSNGITVYGKIRNLISGKTQIINTAGGVNLASGAQMTNAGNSQKITNTGNGVVIIAGTMSNNSGVQEITSSGNGGIQISGTMSNSNSGNLTISNTNTDASGVEISGSVSNNVGNIEISNDGTNGTTVSGSVANAKGNTTLTNNAGGVTVATSGEIKNSEGDMTVSNSGSAGISILGKIKNLVKGNTKITNTLASDGGITIASGASVENTDGNTEVENNGAGTAGIKIAGILSNKHSSTASGKVTVKNNKNGGIEVSGTVTNEKNGDLELVNEGVGDIKITSIGKVENQRSGNTKILNNNTAASGIVVAGSVINNTGNIEVTNAGDKGILISGSTRNNGAGDTIIINNNTEDSKIEISGNVTNSNGSLNVINKGNDGILVSGAINDILGVTTISNDNASSTAGITLTSSGRITNDNGNILVNNVGRQGIIVEGIIKTIAQSIIMNNSDSDVVIGDNTTNNFYIDAQNGDIKITQVNGNILNSGVDKTLIRANGKLNLDVTDGNIGSVAYTTPANVGLGINADTRDARESVNVNVSDTITAKATQTDKTTAQSRLINLRSKNSDMKVNQIKADGNVILSATDWKQADQNPTPNDENYFRGYSILNASADSSKANVEGYNISMLSSNNIGENSKWLTYNQYSGDAVTSAGYLSAEAENDLYLRGLSDGYDTNIWQLISKRGNMGLELPGDSIIREITANKNLSIVNRGKNLTIYDLGRLPHLLNPADDVLYPHDRIALSDVVPQTLNLTVLDINSRTRVNPLLADSTLNIFNAFVRGRGLSQKIDGIDTPVADIVLRADNVIANAYGAPSSPVSTLQNPSGFDGSAGRTYADNPLDLTAAKNLKATGFNSFGNGSRLVFDLRGVSPDLVSSIGRNINERNYYNQPVIKTIEIFSNPLYIPGIDYKMKNVALSVNSNDLTLDNRGTLFRNLYANNAYIDTRDLNLDFRDTIISNYAEFRNGNRAGSGGYTGNYRWTTVVDNDYRRLVSDIIPVTLQLYTQKTGSFSLEMGNLIVLVTQAPPVHYDPYEVTNVPQTENSFYRLTYKEDKIQKTTTTPEFKDIDKDTYKPTKRISMRFENQDTNISSNVDILDLSKGGAAVHNDGSLKLGDKFEVNIVYEDMNVKATAEVVRVGGNTAGVKFVNLDKATTNKLLYINMLASKHNKSNKISKL